MTNREIIKNLEFICSRVCTNARVFLAKKHDLNGRAKNKITESIEAKLYSVCSLLRIYEEPFIIDTIFLYLWSILDLIRKDKNIKIEGENLMFFGKPLYEEQKLTFSSRRIEFVKANEQRGYFENSIDKIKKINSYNTKYKNVDFYEYYWQNNVEEYGRFILHKDDMFNQYKLFLLLCNNNDAQHLVNLINHFRNHLSIIHSPRHLENNNNVELIDCLIIGQFINYVILLPNVDDKFKLSYRTKENNIMKVRGILINKIKREEGGTSFYHFVLEYEKKHYGQENDFRKSNVCLEVSEVDYNKYKEDDDIVADFFIYAVKKTGVDYYNNIKINKIVYADDINCDNVFSLSGEIVKKMISHNHKSNKIFYNVLIKYKKKYENYLIKMKINDSLYNRCLEGDLINVDFFISFPSNIRNRNKTYNYATQIKFNIIKLDCDYKCIVDYFNEISGYKLKKSIPFRKVSKI